jgi:cyclopropane-fatty-acyl-phospholipid synthase
MVATRVLDRLERMLQAGGLPLEITLWTGERVAGPNPRVRMILRSMKGAASLVRPTLGKFAELYVEQDLDLEGDSRDILAIGEKLAGSASVARGRILQRMFSHTRRADRKAIGAHYDVGDEFYALWLDARRVYSCAYFRRKDDTLERAQEQKLDHICRKLHLVPGERLLDIGCGWGALIVWAARHYGVHATGVTLSENQYQYVRDLIRAEGLDGRVEVRLQDYRDVPEDVPYDKIASVGMFEHVGQKNLPRYFAKIGRLLTAGGLVLNHGITLNVQGRVELGSGIGGFVERYVFPGGQLPHIAPVLQTMSAGGLEPWDVESLRPHYAKTLWAWVDRLEAHRAEAVKLVGEKRFRIWRIYMAGSAHAFARGWLSVYQVLAGKPRGDGALALPLTRDALYTR